MKLFIFIGCLFFSGCEKSNDSGVSNIEEISGCLDDNACNHDVNATLNDGNCTYAETNHDCTGNCNVSLDCNGTCGGTAVNCPNWVDNPGLYLNSATFAGVIIINNTMNEGDMFAAFDSEGNVRGVAVQLMPPFGPYQGRIVYEMQVRSNSSGEQLTFKYYDIMNDIILDIVETYEFNINEVMGDVINPVMFYVANK